MTATSLLALGGAVALAGALTQLYEVGAHSDAGASVADAAARRGRLLDVAGRHAAARHLLAGLVTGCLAGLVASPEKALVAAALAVGGSVVQASRAAQAKRRAGEAGVPALARSLADALRGGAAIRAAVMAAADDRSIPAPLRRVVRSEAAGLALGAPLQQSLARLATAGGPAMRLLCGTVAMHLDAGGALAAQLDRLATEGEAARKIEQDRVAATAQARATVRVVAALPLLALGGAQLASPGFFAAVVGHPIALALLLLGLLLELAAVFAARAIVGSAR